MSHASAPLFVPGTVVALAENPRLAAARAKLGLPVRAPIESTFTVVGWRERSPEVGGVVYELELAGGTTVSWLNGRQLKQVG